MDPSYYSPQTSSSRVVHNHQSPAAAAVCFCRVHGSVVQGNYFHDTYNSPPSPVTRHLMQRHPDAVVVQATSGKNPQMVPCTVVYHQHQPVFGYMAHNTLDGATAIARHRRQPKQQSKCQDPRCCQSKTESSRSKSKHGRRSKNNQTPTKTVNYKSAPSSPVGTPRKLVTNMTANSQHTVINSQLRNNKKELDLNPQWITAFPTVETPSESGFPITSGKLTGCCGRPTVSTARRPRSNSYSALDSTSDDGGTLEECKTLSNKKPVSECVKNMVSWVSQVGDKVGKGTSALIDALPSLKEDHHVVMVGLDSAGKSTVLYRLKFDQYVNTVPTIGFNCERVRGTVGRSRGLTFLIWDVGGQEKVRPLWKSYTRATDAVIYVVDSTDTERLEEAKLELHRIMRSVDNVGVPLIVIANKQDLPSALSPSELEKYLALSDFGPGQLWHLEPSCAVTGEGLDTALDAIHELVIKRRKQKKRTRNKTR